MANFTASLFRELAENWAPTLTLNEGLLDSRHETSGAQLAIGYWLLAIGVDPMKAEGEGVLGKPLCVGPCPAG